LGGQSGRSRDARMASMVENHMPRAYAGARTAPKVLEASAATPVQSAALVPASTNRAEAVKTDIRQPVKAEIKTPDVKIVEVRQPLETAKPLISVEQQRLANIRRAIADAPVQVQPTRTVASTIVAAPVAAVAPVRPAAVNDRLPAAVAERLPAAVNDRLPTAVNDRQPASTPVTAFAPAPQTGPQLRWNTGAQPTAETKPTAKTKPADRVPSGRQAAIVTAQVDPETTASTSRSVSAKNQSGYIIQLGASDDEGKARAILDKAKARSGSVLADASAFTEKVQKGDATLFRARFGGFDDTKEATAACGALKKSGFNCFVQRI
ncbi:MAG: SPOR domain-containing protein, partial [Beijerinckiaceae bacterium]